ncbi:MAG: hypothetical protein INH41_18185 [Myxococcaceae bacterium]|nr:hypothetical protein [Myxococcaceae bacterium]
MLNAGRCAIAVTKERGDQLVELRGKQQLAQGLAEGRRLGRRRGRVEGLHEGRQKGLHEGRQKGLAEGLRLAIVAQWEARFGKPAGRTVASRLARADVETLTTWTQRLVTAKRPADVFG